uniref:xylose isomerase n=2 Tax=Aegilops tauschii subsp. strangulata TaxID=200361 RepID=A0A453LGR1_AEGTS
AIAAQETCRADIDAKCGDAASNDCEGKFFPGFTKINYEGPTSKRALAYKWYNIEEVILIKKMKCGILAYTFRDTGGDLFGAPTKNWPWEDGMNSMAMATRTLGLVTY